MSEMRVEATHDGNTPLDSTHRATGRHERRARALRAAGVGAAGTFAVLGAGQLGAPPTVLALLAAAGALAIAALLDRGAAAESRTLSAVDADNGEPALDGGASDTFAQRGASDALLHDLRAPLLSARATLELLVEGAYGDLDDAAREAAERGAIAAARACSLVEGFQEEQSAETGSTLAAPREKPAVSNQRESMSSVPGPGGAAAIEPVPLEGVLVDVVAALASELEPAGATVRIGPLPAVSGDGDALFRIISNLVQNAVHHTPAGQSPRVEVTAEPDATAARWLVVVRDHGAGVDPVEAESLFERGARGPGAPPGGSGLGLTTARALARELGGDCWLEPAARGGCRAVVAFPRTEADLTLAEHAA